MTQTRSSDTGRIFTAIMLALFVVILLAMTTFGARIFGATYNQKTAGDTARLGQSLIANTIHANDRANAVRSVDGPEGPALVLVERTDNGTFETRLYEYEGNVVEEYALAGNDFDPEAATVMVGSQTFEFWMDGSLLSVATDQGTTTVAMRCLQETEGLQQANATEAQASAAEAQVNATATEAQAVARASAAGAQPATAQGGAA